jgi:hypothetical protein
MPFSSILERILFEDYLMISGDDYFFRSAFFNSFVVFFFGKEAFGFDENF